MNFTVIDCEQGSPDWIAARLGRLTGSRAKDMLAVRKDKAESADRRDLRVQLVCERLTNQSQESQFVNADMKRGTELEPDARRAFEAATGELVETSGFLSHNELLCGSSLDGHLGNFETIIELKAPRPATHLRYLRAGGLPSEHEAQIVHNLFVTGALSAWFVSFCPAFPEPLQLFMAAVKRDEAAVKAYELALNLFLAEVDREIETVRGLIKAA